MGSKIIYKTNKCQTLYGPVSNVVIYEEKQSEAEDAETIVKVFVEFVHNDGAICNFGP